MNEREAQEVVRMVESGWSCDFGMQGRTLWCQMLYPFEPELATLAVVEMSKHPLPGDRFKPQVSDLRQIIISVRNRSRPSQHAIEGKRGEATPEWYSVWYWCRMLRDPREMASFPQQQGHVDPANIMTREYYEKLRAEWIEEGSPNGIHPAGLLNA